MKKLNFLTLVFVILLLVLTSCYDSVDPPKTNLLDKSSIKYFGTSHSAQSLKFYATKVSGGTNISILVEFDLEHKKIYNYEVTDSSYIMSFSRGFTIDSTDTITFAPSDGNDLFVYTDQVQTQQITKLADLKTATVIYMSSYDNDNDENTKDLIQFSQTPIKKVEFYNWFYISQGALFEAVGKSSVTGEDYILNYIVDNDSNNAIFIVNDKTGNKCDKVSIVSANNKCSSTLASYGELTFSLDNTTTSLYKSIEELRNASSFYMKLDGALAGLYDGVSMNKK